VGKKLMFVLFLIGLIFIFGCGGGGSSSGGGSSPSTVVGTWNLVSSTGGTMPQQVIFNSDGTGSISGGVPSDTFTWTQQGSQVIMTFQRGGTTTISNLPSPVGNTVTLVNSSGVRATYTRA